MKDLIIIGAGPAGLSAAIYGVRSGLDTLILEKFSPGGQVANILEIENYPGFEKLISGWDLSSAMDAQAKRLGVEIKSGDVTSIENNKNYFTIKTSNDEYSCKAVILAAGSSYRHLNIPGEMEFRGKGVSYCGTCDAPFFKNKIVAVIGGGSTALEEALFLTKFAAKVILIHRRDEFRGEKVLQDKIRSEKNIELLLSRAPIQIEGAEKVSSLIVKNLKTGNNETINVDGVFIFVGVTPNSSVFSDELKNSNGEIITDINMKTKIPGIFAAGDIRESSKRQIVTACGDGAVAAITAYEFITGFGH